MKSFGFATAALALALVFGSSSYAAETPSATATFSGKSIAVGVGYTWGKGVMSYKGHTYPFTSKGLSALGAGAEKMTGTAEIYNLNAATDLTGVYWAVEAGGALTTMGGGTATLRNKHGVTIKLHTEDKGLDINLAGSGVDIALAPLSAMK